jgi:hypothetical protein
MFGFEHFTSVSKDWIDPVMGLAAHYRVNDKWFVNAQADIGGLDKSATGQALGSVGYNWTHNISTTLGYRVMYGYDKDENARGRQLPPAGVDLRAVRRLQVQLLRCLPLPAISNGQLIMASPRQSRRSGQTW